MQKRGTGGSWLGLTWKILVIPVWRNVRYKNIVDVMGQNESHKRQPRHRTRAGSDQTQVFGQWVPRWREGGGKPEPWQVCSPAHNC